MAEYFDPVDPYGQLSYGDEDELAYFLKVQKEEEQKRKSSGINKAANIGGQLGGAYAGNQAVSGLMSLGSSSGVGAAGSAAPIATASTPTSVLPSIATDLGAAGTTGTTGATTVTAPVDAGTGALGTVGNVLPYVGGTIAAYRDTKGNIDQIRNFANSGTSTEDAFKDAYDAKSLANDAMNPAQTARDEQFKSLALNKLGAIGGGGGAGIASSALGTVLGATPLGMIAMGVGGRGIFKAGLQQLGRTISGKDEGQLTRDIGRERLQDVGLLTDDYNLNYGSNRDFNIGYDGGDQEAIIREEDGRKLHNYDIDWSRKGISDVAEAVRPIAMMVSGGNQKLGEDITGYMVNKALMSGDATKDVMDLYGSSGINFDTGHARLLEMEQSGALTKEQADALRFQLTRYLGQGTFKDQSGGNPMTFNVGDVNTSGRVLGDGEFVDAPVPVIAQPKDINYSDMASKALQKLQEKQK